LEIALASFSEKGGQHSLGYIKGVFHSRDFVIQLLAYLLFRPERFDGVKPGGAPGGVKAKEKADTNRD
jgi:hypothetical protein